MSNVSVDENEETGKPTRDSARFVKHVTVPDNMTVAPGEVISKVWRVRNDSQLAWPENCQLIHIGGQSFGFVATPVRGGVAPGTEADISTTLTVPTAPGCHQCFFRLSAESRKFGQRLWVSVIVKGASSSSDTDDFIAITSSLPFTEEAPFRFQNELIRLQEMGFTDVDTNRHLLTKFRGNVERTVKKLTRKQRAVGAEDSA